MADRNIRVSLTKFFQHRASSIDAQGAVEDEKPLLFRSFHEFGFSFQPL